MYTQEQKQQFSTILVRIAEELDISDSKFKEAKTKYESVGEWLRRKESTLAANNPKIYPQGSFLIGTVVKPISNEEGYDIDLVCELDYTKETITQKKLKEQVGIEIISYASSNNMKKSPEDKRRCWTLDYANEFHMDILPAIPDSESFRSLLEAKKLAADYIECAISITDKTFSNYNNLNNDWPCSNPKGFAEWFKNKMKVVAYTRQKELVLLEKYASVEDVPMFEWKTPLQRTIQILKRHRDIYFNGKENKPISIIITTLSGHAYNNESNFYDAFINIVKKLEDIDSLRKNGIYNIPNPVNPTENFADKWNEDEKLPKAFQNWITQLKKDIDIVLQQKELFEIQESLKPVLGYGVVTCVFNEISKKQNTQNKIYPKVEIRNPNKPWGIL
jgi:hypothetical protein